MAREKSPLRGALKFSNEEEKELAGKSNIFLKAVWQYGLMTPIKAAHVPRFSKISKIS
jgi:hypothetical protein